MHPLLARQLKRLGLAAGAVPDAAAFEELLKRVSGTYQAADDDRYTLERSIDISSKEMSALHQQVAGDRDRLSSVLEALRDAVILAGPDGLVRVRNQSAAVLLGTQAGQHLVGELSLFDEAGPVAWDELFPRVLAGGAVQVLGSVGVRGRPPFPATWTLQPLSGGGSGIVLTVQDETQRRLAEDGLREALIAAEVSARAAQTKDEFLATMSHELRTPLNAILGYSEMLNEDADPETGADLEKVIGAGRHLLALIDNILDLSKVDAGHIELFIERIEPVRLLDELLGTSLPLAQRNQNRIVLGTQHAPPAFAGDLTRIRQCLFNLIGNACKFTDHGLVEVEVTSLADGSPGAVFSVRDTGIGMTRAQLELVFEPFKQADRSTTRRFGGTGLGLAVTRKLARRMGGEVTATSEPGRGSTFVLIVPDAGQVDTIPEHARTPDHCEDAVLVIEDDASARELIARMLQKEGLRVVSAGDGELGLRLARELRPSVVVLDVMLPGLDGLQVLEALRRDPATASIPVIVCTMTEQRRSAVSYGVIDWVPKPVVRHRLLAAVARSRGVPR
jgi:signal transduction histidine kinase